MKVYHIADQNNRTLDLYEMKFYENADPVYCLDRAYLDALIAVKKKDHLVLHVVTTLMEDADLENVDLY
jgi:hypothetical protein